MGIVQDIIASRYTVHREGEGWRVHRRGQAEGTLFVTEDAAWAEADQKADDDYDRAASCGASSNCS